MAQLIVPLWRILVLKMYIEYFKLDESHLYLAFVSYSRNVAVTPAEYEYIHNQGK